MAEPDSTIRSRELGTEMRKRREALGLPQDAIRRKVGIPISKISRMETGHRGMPLHDIASMLVVYGVVGDERKELLRLAKEVDQHAALVRPGTTLAERRRTLIWLESQAIGITNVNTVVMPGLLQTGEYTRALMADSGLVPKDEIEDRMLTRLSQHSVLQRQRPPMLSAIIDEPALRRPVGGRDVQRRQLEHLLSMAAWPTITIRIIPARIGVHAGIDGSFSLLRFLDAPAVVYVESLAAGLFLEDTNTVSDYANAVNLLESSALDREESAKLIARLMFELDPEEGTA